MFDRCWRLGLREIVPWRLVSLILRWLCARCPRLGGGLGLGCLAPVCFLSRRLFRFWRRMQLHLRSRGGGGATPPGFPVFSRLHVSRIRLTGRFCRRVAGLAVSGRDLARPLFRSPPGGSGLGFGLAAVGRPGLAAGSGWGLLRGPFVVSQALAGRLLPTAAAAAPPATGAVPACRLGITRAGVGSVLRRLIWRIVRGSGCRSLDGGLGSARGADVLRGG